MPPAPNPLGPRVRAAASIVASLYLAVQLCMAAWVAVPMLALGWAPEIAVGDEMRPSLRPGDVVLVDPRPSSDVPVGALVVLADDSVRRVAKVTDDGRLRTKGDAAGELDERVVRPADVQVGRLLVPLVGTPAMWWLTGSAVPFAMWSVSVAAATVLARRPHARGRAAGRATT